MGKLISQFWTKDTQMFGTSTLRYMISINQNKCKGQLKINKPTIKVSREAMSAIEQGECKIYLFINK